MKTTLFWVPVLIGLLITSIGSRAGDLHQTFESGEVTTNWGSTWNNGTIVPGFLNPSLGGTSTGSGNSAVQTYSRSFTGNSAGISLSQPYYISMYIQADTTNTPASGQFDVIDGSYGASAADLHVGLQGMQLVWQAKSSGVGTNNGFVNIGLDAYLGNPYWIMLAIDPTTGHYSATVESVDSFGTILASASINNLVSDANVFGNHQNGNLLLYLQASAGSASVRIDDILISSSPISTTPTPEPSSIALLAVSLTGFFGLKKIRFTA